MTNTFVKVDWSNEGLIDGADLALWHQNYNPPGLGILETTPEPAALALLLGVQGSS